MAIHFSRSLRSLNRERIYTSTAVVISASLIIVGWLAWFFLAPVTLYESSTQFTVRRDGQLMVEFSDEALARIRSGQDAVLVIPPSENAREQTLPAFVTETPASMGRQAGTVQIYIETSAPLPDNFSQGAVKVAVETVSPFTLLVNSQQFNR